MSADRQSPSVAEALANAIAALRPADVPDAVRRVAEDLVLDVFGLCVAARRTDYVRALLAATDGDGDCSVIGRKRRLSAAGAALVNGTAAHG